MKLFAPVLMFMVLALFSHHSLADPSPAPSIVASSPMVMAPAVVAVAEPAAPPAWAQDLMVSAQKLPVIGPVVTKATLYLGILSSLLTLFTSFIIAGAAALSGAFNYAGLTKAVAAITAFQNGKFMYYIKFFSLFNAKKPDPQ